MIQTGIVSKVKIGDILSNQLPEFIRDESPLAVDFLKQYYISQEFQGGSSDLIDNLDQYLNVTNLTPEVIVDSSTTVGITTVGDKTIEVTSTKGFPNQYGLLKIDDEIITYTGITTNTFTGCKRGFSGITSYHSETNKEDLVFNSSSASEHTNSSTVQNLSSLFLKEFYKKFKKTFLPGLEETNFQPNLDVGTFIGEARSLYQTKGTEESFRILFNILYGITPNILNLEGRLIKPSSADYVRRRVCVAELLEGNPRKLKGQSLLKGLTGQTLFRSDLDIDVNASISEIEPFERRDSGLSGITTYYKIGLFVGYDESSDIAGDFVVVPNTKAIEKVEPNSSVITVDSTVGFGTAGTIISGTNTITYTDKTVNQFLNCTGVGVTIDPVQNVRSNITYFGFEDGDLDRKVVLRLTGVLSEFEQSDILDVNKGEIVTVKNVGDKIENNQASFKQIFSNSWIYNTSSSYFIIDKDENGITLGGTVDRSSLKEGDKVDIVLRNSNTVVQNSDTIYVNKITGNQVTLSDNDIIPNFLTEEDTKKYKLRKGLNKPNSLNTPIEFGNNLISDIQNIYTQGDAVYVASNSLPSFTAQPNQSHKFFNQIVEKTKSISVGFGTTSSASSGIATFTGFMNDDGTFSNITCGVQVPFKTGDRIFYNPEGGSLVGLETGSYFVEIIGSKSFKLYGSPSAIDNGENLSFLKNSDESIHNFTLYSQRSNEIGSQKLFKKFNLDQSISNGVDDLTPVGETGMLINGVEITNYKSADKIFFGPLSSVDLLNGGDNYDVINLPDISISNGIGTTALVQPVISGSIEEVLVDPQDFDIDKVVSIGITGGNGTGCVLEPVIGTRFRKAFFKTAPKVGGGSGINTVSETITFIGDHNFADGEPVIYDSNSREPINIVGVGTNRLSNGAVYYVGKDNDTTIRLFETFENYQAGTPKINFKVNTGLGNQVFKVGLRNSLLGVNVINGGQNYTNRKLYVKSTGVSTSTNLITFNNHGFKDGDLVEYSGNIVGLNTNNSYYILKNDDNSFNLSNAGIGGTIISNYSRRNITSLESSGTGLQTFSFPDIKVFANFDTLGSGTTIPTSNTIVATPKVKGSIQQLYLYEAGTGYGSTILNNHRKPIITIKQGRNASLTPVIENGEIIDVNIGNKGSEYFSTPDILIEDPTGAGAGAQIRPIINNQKLEDVVVINSGIGYSTSTNIKVKSSGINALFDPNVRDLSINKNYEGNFEHLEESENKLKFSYVGYSTSPFKDGDSEVSGLIGWAYDGNPIYGPFAFADPSNLPSNNVGKKILESGYELITSNVVDRPDFIDGYFVEDYTFTNNGDLDEHNGRFEKTTEFPQGRYVYHAVVDSDNKPVFPYFIGSTYRSKKIDFNFDNVLQPEFDFNQGNILRNTFPYKVSDDFANNDFIVETNEINDQQIEITSVSSGSITGFNILNSGSDYKVGELLRFDDTDTGGSNLSASISKINGESISNLNTNVQVIQDVTLTWSESSITASTSDIHNLKNNDIVNITGLTTDLSSLNGVVNIKLKDILTSVSVSTITGSPSAGLTTEIFLSRIPSNIIVGDSIGIGTETLKILNIYKDTNVLTVERASDTSFGTEHPKGSEINFISNQFTFEKSIPKFESQVNKKIFFNPYQTVGVGTFDGTEHTVTFDFAGKNVIRNIPIKQINLENHGLKTNEKLILTKPAGTNIAISTDNNPATTFNIPSILYAVNKGKDTIGIKTGLGANFDEVYFTGYTNGDNDKFLFETDFDKVKCDVEKRTVVVSVSTSHNLNDNDQIDLTVNPKLSVGIGTSTAVKVSRDLVTGFILVNPIGFNSTGINTVTNSININEHELVTGQKVKYSSNLLPEGLSEKNYFVYKVDDDNIKLCETLIDATKDIPEVVGIGSTGGSSQTISKINPEILSVKNNNLTFDLSDTSLSGYEFKLYYDQEFNNEFISDGNSDSFNVVKVGSGLTIGYGTSLPEFLYYNLEKSGFISTVDVGVKNSSKIKFIDSEYTGSYNITKIDDTSFSLFLNKKPEKLSYTPGECSIIKYDTSSKTVSGGISKIHLISGGSDYKKVPNFIGVGQNSIGRDAIIIPTSKSIGFVESVRIINEGFEYSSDKTLEPESLISPTIEIENSQTLGIVSVTNGGADYITAPDIVIINSDNGQLIDSGFIEPVMLENSILSTNITEIPIGLPANTVTLRTVNNTNGITILEVKSNAGTAYTCKLSTPQGQFTSNPFAVNDRVFIEGIEKISGVGSGFNSKDYGYNLLKVTGFDANVNGFAEVTIDVSEYGTTNTGIAKTILTSFANVINQQDYPQFFVTQNQSKFTKGEKLSVFRNNNLQTGNFEIIRSDVGNLKVFTKETLFVGDRIVGKISGSQANISKVSDNIARLKTDFSILKDVGWNDDIGKLSEDFQVISDNDYYQNMSYSVQSPIEWRNLRTSVNNILHTSGMKNFADTGITSTSNASIGSTESIDVTLDLFGNKRVDEIRSIDTVRDEEVLSDNTTSKISFDNIRLSNYVSCDSNDVLVIDDINQQFSNLEGNPNKFIDLFQFGSQQVFKNLLIRVTSASGSVNRVQFSDFILLSNGSNNVLLEKSRLINSGIGLTTTEESNFATFKLNEDNVTEIESFRFEPTLDPNSDIDYDLKIFTSDFNTDNDGIGTQLVGPIFLNSRIETCAANGTTLVAIYNLTHGTGSDLFYESNYSSIHAIDTVDNSMNYIEALVSNSGDDTFVAQAYADTGSNGLSLNQIGIVTSYIENIGSDPYMFVTFVNNSSNPVKVKSKNIGFGTVGNPNDTYRFKSPNQLNGSERTSIYSGITSVNTGVSTFISLNSQLFNTVKSVVEVSIGASKAVHEVTALHDGVNAYIQPSESLSITKDSNTEYDPSSGLGTFSASYTPSHFQIKFHPDDSVGVSTVVTFNHCFYTSIDTVNDPLNLTYGPITEDNEVKEYNAVEGDRVNRTEFTLKNNNVPIFSKNFNPSLTSDVILSSGKFNIPNHFFRENEELIYTPKSTFVGVGSTPMQFKNGSIIDTLPTTVFAKTVTKEAFFISTTRAGAAVTFTGIGEGNFHEFAMAKRNEKALISVDDTAQYPLIRTDVTHTLENNVGSQVGLTTTIINLSGISTITVNDILKIDNELVRVRNVGVATTNGSPVGTGGTFNLVEVERSFVGTINDTHSDGTTIERFKGNYNIVGSNIFFTDPPRGNPSQEKDDSNLDTPRSDFNGRVYLRNDYGTNEIYDDISDQFTGITTTFTLKVGGANTVGLGTTGGSGILFINGVFQSPSTVNNPDKNFKIIESGTGASGVSSVFFTGITSSDGSPFISNNNINLNELPRGGVPVSFGSTVTGLGYAPTVGAKVKALTGAGGTITSVVGVAYSGSDLGIVTATYNNVTGIVTIQTTNEHKFKNSNETVLLESLQFDPALSLTITEFPVVSIAATNVFGANIGKNATTHAYVGSGTVKPKFSNLTFGSGYNGLGSIGVTVKDFGYEHRFVSADVNGIDKNGGADITATNAEYDPTTGIMIVTSPNHNMNNGDLVKIKDASMRFTCSRDNFQTVHPYPRSTDPVAGINTVVTKITDDVFRVNVGANVGTGAQISAVAGVGGTAIFTIDAEGSGYQDPQVFVSEPSYSNLEVAGVSRIGIGATTDTGTNLKVNAVVSASSTTGIGSTLFGISRYEIVDSGFGFKRGDVVEAVGLVTAKGMNSFSPKSTLSVDETYSDSFAMWQFGEFDYIDSIKSLQNGVRTKFPLNLNNELISVEASANLISSVSIEGIFLVTVNGIIQEPIKAYTISGGTAINFSEPPAGETIPGKNDGDDISILFYKGTGGVDSQVIEGATSIIKTGDEVRIESFIDQFGNKIETQDNRTVTGIRTSTTLDTNVYRNQGISETISRPLTLIRQKVDKTINKVFFSKKRDELEPRINPTAKIIDDVLQSDSFFFVDNADYFNYEDESTPIFTADLISGKPTVGAAVTAIVNNTGQVSAFDIINPGSGYASAPTIQVAAPVGGGTTATGNTVIGADGTVILTSPVTSGTGYTNTNPPQCIIGKPPLLYENLTTNGVTITESTGIVTGISTTMFNTNLAITFTIKRSGDDFNPIAVGDPIYIFDTNVGDGIRSLVNGGENDAVVGIGVTFVDNIYQVASFTNNGDVGFATCCIDSNTITTGISAVGFITAPVGKYSVGKISGFTRSSSPIIFNVKGLTVDSGLSTFPTLKRTGGSDTLAKTGGLITPS